MGASLFTAIRSDADVVEAVPNATGSAPAAQVREPAVPDLKLESNRFPISAQRQTMINLLRSIESDDDPLAPLCLEALTHPATRHEMLGALTRDADLITASTLRAQFLCALRPFPAEPLVLSFAAQSLTDPRFRAELPVVDSAARILSSAKCITPGLVSTIFEYARESPLDSSDLAGYIAVLLLRDWNLSATDRSAARALALRWYEDRPGRVNPWLEVVCAKTDQDAIDLCWNIISACVTPIGAPNLWIETFRDATVGAPYLKLPIELALACAQCVGAMPLWIISGIGATVFSSSVGFSALKNTRKLDEVREHLNRDRELERIQAAICLASMRRVNGRLKDQISQSLAATADDRRQLPLVRDVSKKLLEGNSLSGLKQMLWGIDEVGRLDDLRLHLDEAC